jgi:hypothetical protein
MLRKAAVALVAAAALAALALACGTDAVGVETCKQIEAARCQKAPLCSMIPLGVPPHRDPDVEACIRFYDVACLHGLEVSGDPGAVAVKACVEAINASTDCNTVLHPETDPACAWLIPAPAPVDAGSDAAADGTSDGGDGG